MELSPASDAAIASEKTPGSRRKAFGREMFAWGIIGVIAALALFIQSCPDHVQAVAPTAAMWEPASAWDTIFQCQVHQGFIPPVGAAKGS